MSVEPGHFLRHAGRLFNVMSSIDFNAEPEQFELTIRRIVSASYYANYHACLGFAKKHGYKFDKSARKGTHAYLWMWLEDQGYSDLGFEGRELHTHRVWADYRLDVKFNIDLIVIYDRVLGTLTEIEQRDLGIDPVQGMLPFQPV